MLEIFKSIYFKLIHPNKVAKIKGVNFGKNCNFGRINFGTEPYLIIIGNDFYSSSNINFITHDGSVNVLRNLYSEYKDIDICKPILIGNNVFLGFAVTVLPGSVIGDNVIVGASSLVKGKLESNCVYAGIPVRKICTINEYLEKNKNNFIYTKNMSLVEKKVYLKKQLGISI